MRSFTLLALISLVAAIPIPSENGFEDGVLVDAPNNQPITPPPLPPAPVGEDNEGEGGFTDSGRPVTGVANNSPVTNDMPLPPVVNPIGGGNDGGFVGNGQPVANVPAAPPTSIFGTGVVKKATAASTGGVPITAQNIIDIAPEAASCSGRGDECRDATIAADKISESFSKFGVTTKGEAAAILSLMMFESGNFQFNQRQPVGSNPGQGTFNLMQPNFVKEYAKEVLPGDASVDTATPDQVLAKVNGDDLSFGSGAWFYARHCDQAVKTAVQSGTVEGWTQYITQCIQTTVGDRQASYDKAKQVLGA